MDDLARNHNDVLAQSADGPVAVVVNNRPVFYVMSPQAMQAILLRGLLTGGEGHNATVATLVQARPATGIDTSAVLTVDVTEKKTHEIGTI
jgi:hypothetical protein